MIITASRTHSYLSTTTFLINPIVDSMYKTKGTMVSCYPSHKSQFLHGHSIDRSQRRRYYKLRASVHFSCQLPLFKYSCSETLLASARVSVLLVSGTSILFAIASCLALNTLVFFVSYNEQFPIRKTSFGYSKLLTYNNLKCFFGSLAES